jgi:lipopolysaccharide/colanic/teichoic acid biosynthesis glycosyltransferase
LGFAVGLALSPVVICAMIAVRILSRRTPLIAHQRCGLHGEPFWMLKIRTMWGTSGGGSSFGWIEHITDTPVPIRKNAPDPRVTSRLAACLRRYSLDELPQVVHVVTGRMRFIGPRPLTPEELGTYYGVAAEEVLSVAPGLTGLWQVMGRNRLTYAQRRRLDLFLVRKRGLGLKLRILAATPLRVLSGRDAW